MKKFKSINLFFALICSMNLCAQSKYFLNIEAGSSINTWFKKEERFLSKNTSDEWYNYTFKHYTTVGSFLKLGIEKQFLVKKLWSFHVSYGLSYLKQITKYHLSGFYWGCGNYSVFDKTINQQNEFLNPYLGLGVNYQSSWVIFSGTAILNKGYIITKNKSQYFSDHFISARQKYLSSQFAFMFRAKNKVFFGPTCEVYYLSFNRTQELVESIQGLEAKTVNFETYKVDLNRSNFWINPGIKIQVRL